MRDELSQAERDRLGEHFDWIKTVHLEPLKAAGPTGGMPAAANAVQVVDALALAYTQKGSMTDRWRTFADDYMPPTLAIADWYGELRSLMLHNLSAGSGLRFISNDDPRSLHGQVTDSGGTVVHVAQLVDDTVDAYHRFRQDAMTDPDIGRIALGHFDAKPPVRVFVDRVAGTAIAASATGGTNTIRP